MSLLTEQRILLAKIEGTAGTAEALSASDGVFNVYTEGGGPAITQETGFTQRDGQSAFSPIVGIAQGYQGRARFSHDLFGGSTSPDWALAFLAGCGMSESSRTWSVVTGSATAKTLTIGEQVDGVVRYLYGAVGTWTLNLKAGEIGRMDFEFVGLYGTDADVALATPSYPTTKPPRWAQAAGCVYNSQTLRCDTATFAQGNELKLRENANRTAGFETGIIVNRRATVSLDPERVVVATVNWDTAFKAGTEATLSIVVGTTTNNIITITGQKWQQFEPPQVEDRGGVAITRLNLQGNRNAAAGDDEFTLVFS